MFGLFNRKPKEPDLDYGVIGVDMHSHVLPGIDDGAQNVEESIVLIKAMMDMGVKKIIATPHVMFDYYRNTPETVNAALQQLKIELTNQGITIPIEAAAEYLFDEYFIELVDTEAELLTMPDKHILTEFSFVSQPPVIINTLMKLKDTGYKPILAHPERYPYYTLEEISNLRDWGFKLQINTISLTGYYGKETKLLAEKLVENNLVDFISSDMHHPRHADALKHALTLPHVKKLLKTQTLQNSLLL